MLFDNLSPIADFSSKIQLKIDILNKNILYVTHTVDKILVKLNERDLRQQSLDYYGKKYGEELGQVEDISQTDLDEQ